MDKNITLSAQQKYDILINELKSSFADLSQLFEYQDEHDLTQTISVAYVLDRMESIIKFVEKL